MAKISDTVKIRFKKKPRGFVAAFKKAMEDKIKKNTPVQEGKLLRATRVVSLGNGEFKATNSKNYASYVEKTGPGSDQKNQNATTRFLTREMTSRAANALARKVRKQLGGK
jgi:hypothetical protein